MVFLRKFDAKKCLQQGCLSGWGNPQTHGFQSNPTQPTKYGLGRVDMLDWLEKSVTNDAWVGLQV